MAKKIAYIVSRFPTVTETFITYEILELKRMGIKVDIFPLLRQDTPVEHVEVEKLREFVHYSKVLSISTILAQFYWLLKKPGMYFWVWWRVLVGNFNSLKFLVRALVTFPIAAKIALQMEKLGIDHVHAHWATHPTLAAYVIRKLTDLTYSFTAHAHDIYVERPMLDEKIREASFLVTISEFNKGILHDLYGEIVKSKTFVVRCGVDLGVFKRHAPKKSNNVFSIICIASLKDYKGHVYLIQACSQLKSAGFQFRCHLVGDGVMRHELESMINELDLSDNVKLFGFQPRHIVKQYLAEADVMVLPSIITPNGKKEGIPVALMEALALEVPVISTSISGIPELIIDGKTGLLVPERSSAALARAIMKLYNTPKFAEELGKAGRIKVINEYNLRQNVKKLYTLFNQNWMDKNMDNLKTFELC